MLFVCIVLSDCVNGRYTAGVTWLWKDAGQPTRRDGLQEAVRTSVIMPISNRNHGGNTQREFNPSSHRCVPVTVAPVFSCGVGSRSHGCKDEQEHGTKHLSGVTGPRSSVVIVCVLKRRPVCSLVPFNLIWIILCSPPALALPYPMFRHRGFNQTKNF